MNKKSAALYRPIAIVMVGPPGCGKSTAAKKMNVDSDMVIIERDIIREGIGGSRKGFYDLAYTFSELRDVYEAYVSSKVDGILKQCAIKRQSVIIADTNMNKRYRHEMYDKLYGLGFQVRLHVFHGDDVNIDELIRRNETRDEDCRVPMSVLTRYDSLMKKQAKTLADEFDLLSLADTSEHSPHRDNIIICDIDDTLAFRDGNREPFEFMKSGSDSPIEHNIKMLEDVVNSAARLSKEDSINKVYFFSGRSDICRVETEAWLTEHVLLNCPTELVMRKEGDYRKDWIIKGEMYRDMIHGKYTVKYVFDDRQSVVGYWSNLGLPVIQVNQSKY